MSLKAQHSVVVICEGTRLEAMHQEQHETVGKRWPGGSDDYFQLSIWDLSGMLSMVDVTPTVPLLLVVCGLSNLNTNDALVKFCDHSKFGGSI